MEKEPTNLQAQSLASLIEQAVTKGSCSKLQVFSHSHFISEGYVGMALAGGVAALGTLVIAGLIRRAVRK